jgi:hypothetical protein
MLQIAIPTNRILSLSQWFSNCVPRHTSKSFSNVSRDVPRAKKVWETLPYLNNKLKMSQSKQNRNKDSSKEIFFFFINFPDISLSRLIFICLKWQH